MGNVEIETCSVCDKKDVPILRKYYYYDIKCDCCNGATDNHFEIVRHCNQCAPKPPRMATVMIKPLNP